MLLKDVNATSEATDYVNSLNDFQKAMLVGKALRMEIMLNKEKEILDLMYEKGRGHHVLSIIGPYAVIEANNEREEYPFTSAFYKEKEGKWVFTNHFWDTMEVALLHAIGCSKEGQNSKFAHYAYNMLRE